MHPIPNSSTATTIPTVTRDLKRDPGKESKLGAQQWHGSYWGPQGAVALAEEYFMQFFNQGPQTRLWAYMSLASVYYSAAGSAATIFSHIKARNKCNVWGMLKWARTSYRLLTKAWQLAQGANSLIDPTNDVKVSSSDCDVLQSIARKYYRTLWWDKPHGYTAKVVLGLAAHSIETALKMADCTDISRCLLHIGRADLLWLQIEPHNRGKFQIAIFDTLLEVWDIAMRIGAEENDWPTKQQLSRVFRNIVEISKRIAPFQKELMPKEYQAYPSSADELCRQAGELLLRYLELGVSIDQSLKSRAILRLPNQPVPPRAS